MSTNNASKPRHWLIAAGVVVVAIAVSFFVLFVQAIANVARLIGHSGSALPILIPVGMAIFLLVDRQDKDSTTGGKTNDK